MVAERTPPSPRPATGSEGLPDGSSRRPLSAALVGGVVSVAAVGWLLWRAFAPSTPEIGSPPAVSAANAGVPTIVVLPFENLGATDDEYFADGMTDEIRSRLVALDDLKVISRASAMRYKDAQVSTRQLGEELGVDYVLNGTVRWQRSASGPSEVRVTPELIQVADDTQQWTHIYNEVLADIFEVQSQIASGVIARLGIALAEPARAALAARPTENFEAYDLYLQGNAYLHRSREVISPGDGYFAIQLLNDAVRLDPAFAVAHARLSVAHNWLWDMYEDRTQARLSMAREAVDVALDLDPTLPEAHHARGLVYMAEGEHERAIDEYRRVLNSRPNNAEVYEALSIVQAELGDYRASYASLTRAAELSPRLGSLECSAGGRLFALREFDEALAHHLRAIQLTPDRALSLRVHAGRLREPGWQHCACASLPGRGDSSRCRPRRSTADQLPLGDDRDHGWPLRGGARPAGVRVVGGVRVRFLLHTKG